MQSNKVMDSNSSMDLALNSIDSTIFNQNVVEFKSENQTKRKETISSNSLATRSTRSTSSDGEYDAILALLSGTPMTPKPVPLILVVVLVSAVILLVPLLTVWGINSSLISKLADRNRKEALLRSTEALYSPIFASAFSL